MRRLAQVALATLALATACTGNRDAEVVIVPLETPAEGAAAGTALPHDHPPVGGTAGAATPGSVGPVKPGSPLPDDDIHAPLRSARPQLPPPPTADTAALPKLTPPAGWKVLPPSSNMRVQDLEIPPAAGETEPVRLGVFYFGGNGGGVEANVQRWLGQLKKEDGSSVDDVAKVERVQSGRFAITYVEAEGVFQGDMTPGMAPGTGGTRKGHMLLGAIIESTPGYLFVKATGPTATMTAARADFRALCESAGK